METKKEYWLEEKLKYNRNHPRLVLVAEIINSLSNCQTIVDTGAGCGTLAKMVDRRFHYLGLDITGTTNGQNKWPIVKYCNFDTISYEQIKTEEPADILVISGLLEYLENWEDFIKIAVTHLCKQDGYVIVSFISSNGYKFFPFLKHLKWKNTFTIKQIDQSLLVNNLKVIDRFPLFSGGILWQHRIVKKLASFAKGIKSPFWLKLPCFRQILIVAQKSQMEKTVEQ